MAREALMTRKHYEMIAATINTLNLAGRVRGMDYAVAELREYIAAEFGNMFASMDRTFNGSIFMAQALKGDRKRAEKLTKRAATRSGNGAENSPLAAVDGLGVPIP